MGEINYTATINMLALKSGLFANETVVDWADQLILSHDVSSLPDEIMEISLGLRKTTDEMIALLETLVVHDHVSSISDGRIEPYKVVLKRCVERFEKAEIDVEQFFSVLYRFVEVCGTYIPEDVKDELSLVDDRYLLARDLIFGEVSSVVADTIDYLRKIS